MTARDVDDAVGRLAAAQHGAFSRAQALGCGATAKIVRRRRESGAWIARADGVYVLRGARDSWLTRLWIACIAPGVGAVVSHEAAATLHRLTTFKARDVVVTVPHATSRLDQVAIVHQSRRLLIDHLTRVDGLPTTTPARTLCDLAAGYRFARLALVMDDALASKRTSLDDLCVTFDDLACRGRKGTRLMRALLAERQPGYVAPSSVLESLFLRLVRRAGLPRPVLQFPHPSPAMDGRFVDAAWPDRRVLVELDGRRWHAKATDMERDRERDVAAHLVGYGCLRFTYDHVVRRSDWIIDTLRQALSLTA